MDEFIDAILEEHSDLTTRELNRLLRRQFGTYISKGRISYCEDFIDLPSYMTDTLNANDRQAWIKAHPLEESQLGQIQIKERGTIQEQQSVGHYVRKYTISKEGSRDQNREWEIGQNSRYEEFDNGNSFKR